MFKLSCVASIDVFPLQEPQEKCIFTDDIYCNSLQSKGNVLYIEINSRNHLQGQVSMPAGLSQRCY